MLVVAQIAVDLYRLGRRRRQRREKGSRRWREAEAALLVEENKVDPASLVRRAPWPPWCGGHEHLLALHLLWGRVANHVELLALLQASRDLHHLQPHRRHHADMVPARGVRRHRHAQLRHRRWGCKVAQLRVQLAMVRPLHRPTEVVRHQAALLRPARLPQHLLRLQTPFHRVLLGRFALAVDDHLEADGSEVQPQQLHRPELLAAHHRRAEGGRRPRRRAPRLVDCLLLLLARPLYTLLCDGQRRLLWLLKAAEQAAPELGQPRSAPLVRVSTFVHVGIARLDLAQKQLVAFELRRPVFVAHHRHGRICHFHLLFFHLLRRRTCLHVLCGDSNRLDYAACCSQRRRRAADSDCRLCRQVSHPLRLQDRDPSLHRPRDIQCSLLSGSKQAEVHPVATERSHR